MLIKRKQYSYYIDDYGEERIFTEHEFISIDEYEQREFARLDYSTGNLLNNDGSIRMSASEFRATPSAPSLSMNNRVPDHKISYGSKGYVSSQGWGEAGDTIQGAKSGVKGVVEGQAKKAVPLKGTPIERPKPSALKGATSPKTFGGVWMTNKGELMRGTTPLSKSSLGYVTKSPVKAKAPTKPINAFEKSLKFAKKIR